MKLKSPRAVISAAFGPPENYCLEQLPQRNVRAAEVRVAINAAGVSFVDVLTAARQYQVDPPLPFCPGSEAAGTVIELGADVRGWAVGDRVVFSAWAGLLAEEAVLPARALQPIPAGLDFAHAYDNVVGTPREEQVAIFIEVARITRRDPTLGIERAAFAVLTRDLVAAHVDLARLASATVTRAERLIERIEQRFIVTGSAHFGRRRRLDRAQPHQRISQASGKMRMLRHNAVAEMAVAGPAVAARRIDHQRGGGQIVDLDQVTAQRRRSASKKQIVAPSALAVCLNSSSGMLSVV